MSRFSTSRRWRLRVESLLGTDRMEWPGRSVNEIDNGTSVIVATFCGNVTLRRMRRVPYVRAISAVLGADKGVLGATVEEQGAGDVSNPERVGIAGDHDQFPVAYLHHRLGTPVPTRGTALGDATNLPDDVCILFLPVPGADIFQLCPDGSSQRRIRGRRSQPRRRPQPRLGAVRTHHRMVGSRSHGGRDPQTA